MLPDRCMWILFLTKLALSCPAKKENYSALCSFAVHIIYMSVFNPENLARALMPKEVLNTASSLHLALHLSSQSVQVMAVEADSGKIHWLETFSVDKEHALPFEDVVRFVQARNWGTAVFRKTTLSYDTPDFTLAPVGFMVAGKEKELLLSDEDFEVQVDAIDAAGAQLVARIPDAIMALKTSLPGVRFIPSASLFTQYTISQRLMSGNEFHVYTSPQYMLLTAYSKGEMKLVNHFGAQGNEDVLYHVANAAMRLGIDLEQSSLYLYGENTSTELQELLHTYTQHVHLWNAPKAVSLDAGVNAAAIFPTLVHLLCA